MKLSSAPGQLSTAPSQPWLGTFMFIMCVFLNIGYAFAVPATPQSIQPVNGATNVSSYPTLEVNCNTAETASAQYVIANDPVFSSIVYDSLENTNDVCSHLAFTPLSANTQYFWQARIKNAQSEWSAWSSIANFITGSQAPLFLNVFQDGTASYSGTRDADMRGDAQNPLQAIREWDQGAQDVLRTGRRRPGAASDEIYRSLIKFDLSALTDPNAVQNVYLEMTGHQHGQIAEWFPGHERLNSLYEVVRQWTEGDDIKDVDSETGEVSWSYSERPTQWSIPGVAGASDTDPNADRKASHLLKFVTTNEIGYRTYWSSKGLVDTIKGWIANPSTNQGLFFQADEENIQKTVMVASREHSNQTFHPRLVIISTEQASIGLNLPPVAGRDSVKTDQDTSISIPVLSNDIDHDGAPMPLFIESVDVPSQGTVNVVGDDILYVPDPAYFGMDRFNYTLSDGEDRAIGVVIVEVAAGPLPGTLPLTIALPGGGNGTVSSAPSGLTCPSICTAEFIENAQVVLTANANQDSTFDGWSGAGCSGTGTCTITMTQAESVTASFSLLPPPPPDNESPLVSIVTPTNGETITGGVSIIASASDNVGVVGVLFMVDGAPIGSELTSAPWSIIWNSTTVTPGSHNLSAQAQDAAGNVTLATDVVVIVEAPTGFLQDNGPDGLVALEAEHFHQNTAQGNHSWDGMIPTDASNGSALQALPNIDTNQNTNYATNSPQLDYTVEFSQTGLHYIWVRGQGMTNHDDSLHVGLNGQELSSSDRITGFASSWTWSNQTMDTVVASIDVPSIGTHTVNVWMREDGTIIDKILLTTNPNYPTPTGHGPTESTQGPPPPPDTESPVVTITNPTEGQIVSGSITLQATATDNEEVVGVQFLLNGTNLGSEVTSAPWTMPWDTTTEIPGSYMVSAQARDAAGNMATALEIMIDIETPPAPVTFPLTVTLNGTGNGSVSSAPAGLSCPSTCTAEFLENGDVTLTAMTNADSTFDGWNGAGCSGTGTCIVTMTQAESVAASFTLLPPPPPDTELPVVTIVAPTNGQTVSGTLPLSASASDNVGVVGVQFLLDGAVLGTEITSSPWTMSWDSSLEAPGIYTLGAQARDAAGNVAFAPEIVVTVDAAPLPVGFLQDSGTDGLVVAEAEHYHLNTAQGNHSWVLTNPADASNGDALLATPNSNTNQNTNYGTNSPQLDYTVQFTQTGVHYIWIRGIGTTTRDDSVHVGVDGQEISSSDRFTGFGTNWTWSNQTMDSAVATVNILSAGEHTLNIWMREDGVIIDKILLTTNPNYPTPTGHGPVESSQGPPPPDLTAPTVTITSPADGSTVSGTITVSADASDSGSGVAGVQFFLEGSPLGPELTSPPYSLDWDTTTVSPDLTYSLSAEARDVVGNIGTTALPTMVQVILPGAMWQQDSGADGLLSLEAEHFQANLSPGTHSWIASNQAGFSGDSAMVTDPNTGTNLKSNYAASSPQLDYEVNFTHSGTHYVWIRGIGLSTKDDSIHMGLDGQELSSSDEISSLSTSWTWSNQTMDGPVATIQVTTPGAHTINLWMREDGTIIDKIVLTVNPSYVPSGTGPTESPLQ